MEAIKLNDATSNIFLLDFLGRFKWSHFHGVFASDMIPRGLHSEEEFSIICNLSKSGQKGTHYISIIKYNNIVLYLDPLAMYIDVSDINKFIDLCACKKVIRLSHPIQDLTSWYCGYFCMFFLLFFNRKLKCREELTPFEIKDLLRKIGRAHV